ncbi:alkaline phosphatase D family protein [Rubinisphaera margarita]|uniref:alkaline phosphatase D family protein n=1 Tax=Rubinisphaera margarita TaxID=2909586 RepID=UPI001EE956D9|nr:alkaline phosphatase D family protein [Rubinisphaera margarita]MCG6156418.1 alkaline phosphatase D family protein [Rubinisphaera margarita]
MITHIPRRVALKLITAGSGILGLQTAPRPVAASDAKDLSLTSVGNWSKTPDRVWLGEEFWANPMEDWRITEGAAECQSAAGNRSVHLVTHQLTDSDASFRMQVEVTRVAAGPKDGGAGFRIGVSSDLNEYRSNCFAPGGITAGLTNNALVLGGKRQELTNPSGDGPITLDVAGSPEGNQYSLTLTARAHEKTLGTVTQTFRRQAILGNVALAHNFNTPPNKPNGSRFRFRDWQVGGGAFTVTEDHKFGPILWSMYSLSDTRSDEGYVLKLSGLTGPLGQQDNQTLQLQVQRDGQWETLKDASLDTDAWVATFRIANWDQTTETPFRLLYQQKWTNGETNDYEWTGIIQAEPEGRPLRFGALTCQNDYAFPYEPVAESLRKLAPDMLYFSGDQIYESHGGFGVVRDPADRAILNYLRKYYQFGWSFREAMRDRPTLCLPDDHDVFQGNLWGEGGKAMKDLDAGTSSKGGYREPVRMVNAVHRTCTAHHPDAFDPTPAEQGMNVYYGDLVYGGVSFAIIADRQWKSGPERVDTGSGRADHVMDRDFDTSKLDQPDLVLLGERQEEFLKQWADDWRGHTIKVLLSQTVFAGVATHHGGYDGYLKADLDCGGWPQTKRDETVDILRRSMALHINGDQHLTTVCQYGVERQRDSNWSFCTPAIAAGYPRWWRPDEIGMDHENRPKHGLPNTGEFEDGLGNRVYVYAVGNPEVGTKKNRYEKAHQKGSGLGLVTIDPAARTYKLESFRFSIDVTDDDPSNQFPGWPLTIQQAENRGENKLS